MPDWEDEQDTATENGESAPSESSPEQQDASLNPTDDPQDAEPGEATEAEEGAEESEVPEKHGRADKRIKSLLDEREEMRRQAEAAGLVWDKEQKRFLPKDTEDTDEGEAEAGDAEGEGDESDGDRAFAWEPPEEDADASEVYTDAFWRQAPEQMAENATWRQVAEHYGFNPDEAVANEWAAVKQFYNRDLSAWEQGREARTRQETAAAQKIDADLKALRSDPDFSLSEKARAFVASEVARFQKEGRAPSEIAGILPQIRAKAFYEHRAEFLSAATQRAAQRAVKEAEGRRALLGGQGGHAETGAKATPSLSPEQKALCDEAGVSYAVYARRLAESEVAVNGGIV